MSEHDENLRRELGVTRREMLRRGAVVGGTLLWAAPVIQSIGPSALAQTPNPNKCCFCTNPGPVNPTGQPTQCLNNGAPPDAATCAIFCTSLDFQDSDFCEAPAPTTCDAVTGCSC